MSFPNIYNLKKTNGIWILDTRVQRRIENETTDCYIYVYMYICCYSGNNGKNTIIMVEGEKKC